MTLTAEFAEPAETKTTYQGVGNGRKRGWKPFSVLPWLATVLAEFCVLRGKAWLWG